VKHQCKYLILLLALVLVSIVVVVAAGCAPKADNVIKVATSSPLSGSQAAVGESIKLGAQIAVEEQKEEFVKFGFTLVLDPQDDQADPKVGVAVAQKLIADPEVLAVDGHYNSGVAIPSSEVYKQGNLLQVSPANTHPDVTDRRLPNVNRICARDDEQGPFGADYAVKTLNANKIYVIDDKTTYGAGIADNFEARAKTNGATIVGRDGITTGETDFSAVLNKVAAAKPDLLYFGGMFPEGSLVLKQMRDKGINATFMGADGMDDPQMAKIAGNAVVGAYYTTAAFDINSTPEGKAWAAKYEQQFKLQPGAYAVYGYDAMNVILEALKKAIADNGGKLPSRQQVSDAARSTNDFQAISTVVTFDGKGDNVNAQLYMKQYKTAEWPPEVIETVKGLDFLPK
jgi:branched-chain amino acid transport system substrate-binding protein